MHEVFLQNPPGTENLLATTLVDSNTNCNIDMVISGVESNTQCNIDMVLSGVDSNTHCNIHMVLSGVDKNTLQQICCYILTRCYVLYKLYININIGYTQSIIPHDTLYCECDV